MNVLTLLLPTGVAASTGPGSKTGSGQGATGFEQLLFGLLGPAPSAAAGAQGQTATSQLGAVANAATASATQALLNGTQAAAATAAEATAAPIGLVEAAAKAATAGLAAAEGTNGEAGKSPANVTGAVSEVLLKNGLPGAQPQQQPQAQAAANTAANAAATAATAAAGQATANAAQAVEQATQQVAATVEGATKTATDTVQAAANKASNAAAAAQKTAESAVQKAVGGANDAVAKVTGTPSANASAVAIDAVTKPAGTPAAPASANATGAQAAAAAASGVAVTTVKPASPTIDNAGDTVKKPDAAPASLITSSPEVTTAKAAVKSAVLQAPTTDAGGEGAISGKQQDANSNAARLRANRTAAPLAGETVAQRAEAAAARAAQHPAAATQTAAGPKPADSFVQHLSNPQAAAGDASAILGSGSPGAPINVDGTGAAHAAARHGAPTFVPPAQQVAVQFSRALASGSDHITIHLEPKSLGRVDVQVELTKDGRLHALFIADRPDTLDMLQRDARVLERALNDAGLRADSGGLSFNLRGNGGDLPQFAGQSAGSQTFSLEQGAGVEDDAAPAAARHAALNADALLDIRV